MGAGCACLPASRHHQDRLSQLRHSSASAVTGAPISAGTALSLSHQKDFNKRAKLLAIIMLLQRGADAETDVRGGERSQKQFTLCVIFKFPLWLFAFRDEQAL